MAATELAEISRSIKSALGESSGGFRKAANDNNAVIGKLNRDLGRYFASMKSQLSEISETNSEIAQNTEKLVSKTDRFSSVLSESVSIQNQLYNEMRNVVSGVKVLNGGIGQLQNSVAGAGTSTLLGKIGLVADGVTSAVGFLSRIATISGAGYLIGKETGMIGGGETGTGNVGKGVGESGSSSEAMSFFQSKGWSKEQAAGIVGNLQTESGKNLRTDAVGDSGQAYGIAQWHPDRQRKFQEVMGIPIRQSNFKQQLEFVNWELNNTEKRAGQMLKGASSAIEAAKAIDYGYERSTHQHLGERMANAAALAKSENKQTPSSDKTTETTPKPENQPTPNASGVTPQSTPLHLQPPAGEHGGIMSGAGGHGHEGHGKEHATKAEGKLSGVNQDILSKFNQIQSQSGGGLTVTSGYRSPEQNAKAHGAKNSAHMRGNAVDVVFGGGVPQALKLIDTASKVGIGGIGVYNPGKLHFDTESKRAWGPTYHSDSIPGWAQGAIQKHLSGAGGSNPSTGKEGSGVTGAPVTPSMGGGGETTGGGGGDTGTGGQESPAAQISPAAVSGLTGGAISSLGDIASEATSISGMGSLGGMMGGFEGVSGALGGMGIGMNTGSLLSAFGSAMESNAPQMMPTPSQTSMNVEQLNNEAVINEAMNQINSERAAQNAVIKAEEDNNLYNANIREGMPIASDYNRPEDKMLAPEWMHGIEYRGYREFNPLKYG